MADKANNSLLAERASVACLSEIVEVSTEAKSSGDASPGRIHYGLFCISIFIGFLALAIWPFDKILSDILCISRVGHVATPLWWETLKGVRVFGKSEILFLIAFLMAIHRRKQVAVSACVAILIASLMVLPAKLVVGRSRPDGSNHMSFPSGDVASLTAFVIPVASAFPVTLPLAFAGVVTVGAVRVANGFHFPSDILTGIAIGVFAAAIVLSLRLRLKPLYRRMIRRSWLAAVLGAVILVHLFLPSLGNFRTFFAMFGPLAVLLAVFPFIRAWFRDRKKMDKRLLSVAIFSLAGPFIGITSWFLLKLVPILKVKLPPLLPADPEPVWAMIAMGGVLAGMILLGVREYSLERYRSTLGILMVGMAGLFFIIFTFASSHGWSGSF